MEASEALQELFSLNDYNSAGYLTLEQLSLLYDRIRIGGISVPQISASLEFVCGNSSYVFLEELKDLLQEMDRRYYLLQDLQWEFALLDNQHVGSISVEKARFLFQAVHGKLFSLRKWGRFLHSRLISDAPITFSEIEVDLCNIPTPEDFDLFDLKEKHKLRPNKDNLTNGVFEKRKDKAKKQAKHNKDSLEEKAKRSDEKPKTSEPIDPNQKIKHTEEEARRKEKQAEEERARKRAAEEEEEEKLRKRKQIEEEEIARRQAEEELRMKKEQKERKKREKKEAAKLAKGQRIIREKLEDAVESRDREKIEPAVDEYKAKVLAEGEVDELLRQAQRMLEMLKCSGELKSATSRRVVSELESAINKARKSGFDRSKDELADEVANANELLLRLQRLERLRSEVLELKQSTIAELRSYQNPIPVIRQVMIATYLLLGTSEKETKKWTAVQALLGKTGREGLKRRIAKCDVVDITLATATRARDIMGEVDLEVIRDVSAGAATFFVWVDGMVGEVMERENTTMIS
ncbi:uncharacterized protein LOC143449335 isoform X1 [Clavelina lepadiformis]|uniref:uncharacterized protein LOC143449335 isoform X1 n=1 Tax=Clavelina lepadiformis TaxID=159417 RepID=UPI004042DE5D